MLDGAVKTFPGKIVQLADFKGKIGIIDQYVDRAKLTSRGANHLLDLVWARHIRLKNHPAAASVLDFSQDFFSRLPVLVIIDEDRSAAFAQTNRGGCPDAPACAGDQNDFSFKRPTVQWLNHSEVKAKWRRRLQRRPFRIWRRYF